MAKDINETARATVILNGQAANASLKEIEASARMLNAELRKLPVNSQEFAKKSEEFNKVKTRLSDVKSEINSTGLSMNKLADGFNKYFAIFTAGAAVFTGMIFSVKNLIAAQGDLSDSLADIRKTTGLTQKEVEDLNKSFGKIDTRTSRQDLRQMAVVAGQLGIAKEDIYAFVDSVDKLNVALGDEMKGGAEEVATQMGKLRNVLTDMKSSNIADDMLRIGNAVNELGAAGFATAPVIVDFASRIGGVGLSLGLTSDEVLGLSATLQELNVSTERGGTAVVKILQKMTTDVKTFAGVAGIPMKEFETLLNTDLFGAFIKVVEGSRKSGQSATELASIIKELEVQGAGASEVFAKMGSNTDMLMEKVKLAGESLQGTGSIMQEFNTKNETLGAKLDKLQKNFYSLITLPGVNQFFGNMIDQVISLVNWFKDLPLFIEKYKLAIIAVTGVTLAWIAAKTRSLQVAIMNNLTLKEGILLKINDSVVLTTLIIKEELLTIWKGKGTIATKLAATAQLLWNATLAASPIGAVVLGVTALVVAIKAYDKYNADAVRNEAIKESTLKRMTVVNGVLKKQYEDLNEQIRNLNLLSVQEKKDLEEKIQKNILLAETELALMQARQKDIGERNSKPTVGQQVWNALSSGGNASIAAIKDANDAALNGKEAADQMNESISTLKENLKNLKTSQSQLLEITRAESVADTIHGKTYEQLSEKLSKYQTALRNTVAGSEEYVRVQNKIKDVNKELAKFKSDGGEGAKKLVTHYEELNKELREYIELLQEQITSDPEQAAITAKKIIRLKEEKQKIDDLVKSYTELQKQTPFTDSSKSGMQMPGDTMSPIGQSPFEDVSEVDPNAQTDIQSNADKANAFITEYIEPVSQALQSFYQLQNDLENRQLARDTEVNDQKKANLKKQLDAKLITQKQYDQGVSKLDADLAKQQRKLAHDQAVRQKEMSLIQAIINVAMGVTAALGQMPPASYVMAALTGVLGAIQIGFIASTPVPAAAKGRYNVIGQDDGKAYNNVPYEESFSGIPGRPMLVNETGNEIVIDPATTKNLLLNYPDVIRAINFARVPQMATGIYQPAPMIVPATSPAMMDVDSINAFKEFTDAIKKPLQSVIVYDNFITEQNKVDKINTETTR